ncbi:inner membrane protein YjiG [Oxobacter pfennigii]|uniref:Inner membrane protein YjiG n=1 Tax=Oxobacter pfennigii TaxID=36849 RepID=A0A0P8WW45_9CLOT|nr:nucleoside recognition domain-containing protein [Oxobacter pfennigii]KPU42473.1 inner membrane protein YjiG [Oxobacter pfennigii]
MASNQPTGNIMNDFVQGCRKGVETNLYNQVPNFIMAYVLIQILEITGLMSIIGKILGPIMGLFGLPGEAAAVLVTAFLSIAGAIGATASLVQKGTLVGIQCAILLPMIYCMGQQVQQLGRILAVAQTPKKYYGPCMIIAVINSIIAGFIMRVIVSFL